MGNSKDKEQRVPGFYGKATYEREHIPGQGLPPRRPDTSDEINANESELSVDPSEADRVDRHGPEGGQSYYTHDKFGPRKLRDIGDEDGVDR